MHLHKNMHIYICAHTHTYTYVCNFHQNEPAVLPDLLPPPPASVPDPSVERRALARLQRRGRPRAPRRTPAPGRGRARPGPSRQTPRRAPPEQPPLFTCSRRGTGSAPLRSHWPRRTPALTLAGGTSAAADSPQRLSLGGCPRLLGTLLQWERRVGRGTANRKAVLSSLSLRG